MKEPTSNSTEQVGGRKHSETSSKTTPAATAQEKSCENTDKSGPYDDKRNVTAREEERRLSFETNGHKFISKLNQDTHPQ
jgi:hypothetical protein